MRVSEGILALPPSWSALCLVDEIIGYLGQETSQHSFANGLATHRTGARNVLTVRTVPALWNGSGTSVSIHCVTDSAVAAPAEKCSENGRDVYIMECRRVQREKNLPEIRGIIVILVF